MPLLCSGKAATVPLLRTIKKFDWTDDRGGITFLRIEIRPPASDCGETVVTLGWVDSAATKLSR
jgi:hypothetical protein